jgi:hypothetical protein
VNGDQNLLFPKIYLIKGDFSIKNQESGGGQGIETGLKGEKGKG